LKYSVITFGCRVNQSDSLGFEEQLIAAGAMASSAESADLVIVNTCSVTASADQGARQTIRRIARTNPHARIVVTGCYATRDADAVRALPNVERVVCNDDKPVLVPLIRGAREDRGALAGPATADESQTTAVRYGSGDGSCGAAFEPGIAGRTAFTLRVQTGCAESCSYCIIPETRGRPRSLPVSAVLAETRRIVAAGFREIALTGVHLGSYGRDLNPASDLTSLLESLAAEFDPKSGRHPEVLFRISSLEPMDCRRDIVDMVRDSPLFAPHFHLPLQHASSRLLRAMGRPYEHGDYADLVEHIRREIPHASIGSDIIVGFPGERDEDFDELATYLERSPLTHLHVFPYSDRPGTEASRMGDRPQGSAVKERGSQVRAIGAALARQFVASQIGTIHRALTLEDGALVVTGNYLKVRIPPGRPRNEWVRVRITAHDGGLSGELA
jgi:threonylcarbamoyladenosine tRNA methylthiotransferase MtaB